MTSQKNVVPDEEHQAAVEDAVGEEHPEAEEDSDEGEVGVRQGAEDSAAAALADEALEEAEVHREVVVDLEAVVVAVVVTVVHDLVCVCTAVLYLISLLHLYYGAVCQLCLRALYGFKAFISAVTVVSLLDLSCCVVIHYAKGQHGLFIHSTKKKHTCCNS